MDKIRVVIINEQKEVKIPTGIRMLVRRCCSAVLQHEDFDGSAEVNVLLEDDEHIRALNAKHRNVNASTDVLSFPLGERGKYDLDPANGMYMLGDIVISMPHAVKQASDYNHSLQREMAFLTAHAMLHLLGYDHVGGGLDAVRMREKEEFVLTELGYPRSESFAADSEQ